MMYFSSSHTRPLLSSTCVCVVMALLLAAILPSGLTRAAEQPAGSEKKVATEAEVKKDPSKADSKGGLKGSIEEKEVLKYLDQLIAWHRAVSTLEVEPGNLQEGLLKDTIRQRAGKVLHLGFDFARASAAICVNKKPDVSKAATDKPEGASAPIEDRRNRVMQGVVDTAQHISAIQTELDAIALRMTKAPARQRASLLAKQNKLVGEMNLAKAQQDLLKNVIGFLKDADAVGTGGLLSQVNNLARSVLEPQTETLKVASAKEAPVNSAEQAHSGEVQGILGLITEMFSLSKQKSQLGDMEKQTMALSETNRKLMMSLRTVLKEAIERGKVIAATSGSDDPETLASQRRELDGLVERYKKLSTTVAPLGEQNMWLDSNRRNFLAWQQSLDDEFSHAFRQFLFRLGALAISIMIPFIISTLLYRATLKYIQDVRRRRQLHLIRRIGLGIAIGLVVFGSFVTEFGSLATFAGFLTAGLAVALQNVILSAVAYFFFFGRFGVRVGDRVTVSGVTGDVVEIGLIRLYLMELGGSNLELYPTGRIISFSNSILFQPAAFFKQIPDTNYTWHEVTLTLPQGADYQLAETKLFAAVESVYAEYRETMKRQQTALERSTHLKIQVPSPQGRLKLVGTAIAFVIRYPVEIGHAAKIDACITKQLLETINTESALTGIDSSPPKSV